MEVRLNPEEQRVAAGIAKLKTEGMEGSKARTVMGNGRTQKENDLFGYGAEMAFCKLVNTYPDLSWHSRTGGLDSRLPDGTRVDVKYSSNPKGDLLVRKDRKKPGEIDIFALLTGEFPRYYFVGYATEAEVFAATVSEGKWSTNYVIPQAHLHKPEKLTEHGVKYGSI